MSLSGFIKLDSSLWSLYVITLPIPSFQPEKPMSFFPTIPAYTTANSVKVYDPLTPIDSTRKPSLKAQNYSIRHRAAQLVNTTLPPMSADVESSMLRIYVFSLDASDPTVFGIYSHFHGRRRWLMVVPTSAANLLQLGTAEMDFPPAGPHPTKFKILDVPGSAYNKYVKSAFYGDKYLCATPDTINTPLEGRFSLVVTPNAYCEHRFISLTSSGPVVPVLPDASPLNSQKYFILTSSGKAIGSSLTSPCLSQVTLNFGSSAQQFFFRAVDTPSPAQPIRPFTYNMYMAASPTAMLCFTDTGNIETRDEAGPWEALIIAPAVLGYFGRFKIESFEIGCRLRANADGVSCSLVSSMAADTSADYFSFMPVAAEAEDLPADNASEHSLLPKVLAVAPVELQIMATLMLMTQGDQGWMQVSRYFLSPFIDLGGLAVIVAHVGICAGVASLCPAMTRLRCPAFAGVLSPAVPASAAALLFMGVAVATMEAIASGDKPAMAIGSAFGIPFLLVSIRAFLAVPSNAMHLLPYAVGLALALLSVLVADAHTKQITVCVITGVACLGTAAVRPHISAATSVLTSAAFGFLCLLGGTQLSAGEPSQAARALHHIAACGLLLAVLLRAMHGIPLLWQHRCQPGLLVLVDSQEPVLDSIALDDESGYLVVDGDEANST